ncbi:MAG: hypothetical protein ABR555_19690 [Pyrinomonadaceae bacterium]
MRNVYGMRRANGDWFALDHGGEFRVPLFDNLREAMNARACNTEMLVFQPALLDAAAIKNLIRAAGASAHFWIVADECTTMKRGRLLAATDLSTFVETESSGIS